MAVSLTGDAEAVRKAMNALHENFRAYCAGKKEPTFDQFERLVTLIVREQGRIIAGNRELIARIRARQKRT
jgi:hypothetical protein